jgi:hypothetical protein
MARTVAFPLLVVLGLTTGTACSIPGDRPAEPIAVSSSGGSPIDERLTPDVAARAFRSFVSNDDVARASGDERLALSWTEDGQAQLTAAEFRKAAFTGDPVARYDYSGQKFYVPRLTKFPKWFVVTADRARKDAPGKADTQQVLMAFVRKYPESRWRLSLATSPDEQAMDTPAAKKAMQIVVDKDGYATPLATFDIGLTIQPRIVPAMQATLAEEGPESLAAKVMSTGPYTSGYYAGDQLNERRDNERGLAYDSVYAATGFPIYPLRTADGGGLVLYALSKDTVTFVKDKQRGRLTVPRETAHLLDTIVLKDELRVMETLQFAAVVPAKPPGRQDQTLAGDQPKAAVIGAGGAVVTAVTSEAD